MATYYRFARDLTLPLHWAYDEAWEQAYDEDEDRLTWDDRRSPGAQVWESLSSVAIAILGLYHDGDYSPAEGYRYLLSINARSVGDSAGEWYAVTPSNVTSVRATSATRLAAWIRKQVAADGGDIVWHDVNRWAERHERALRAEIRARSRLVRVRWVETLPRPR